VAASLAPSKERTHIRGLERIWERIEIEHGNRSHEFVFDGGWIDA